MHFIVEGEGFSDDCKEQILGKKLCRSNTVNLYVTEFTQVTYCYGVASIIVHRLSFVVR